MNYSAPQVDAETAHLAAKLRARILTLARRAGHAGLTISEAAGLIPEHKNTSVSPRFSELVEDGALVRVLTGHSRSGAPRYAGRLDEQTGKYVRIHWARGFEPVTIKALKKARHLTHCVKIRGKSGIRVSG
jgi:hypothetical protein